MRAQDLGRLRVLAAGGELRSFAKAAALLGSSRPAVSRAVRELEQAVGIRLLQRTTRSVALSQAGQRMLARIAPAFAQLDLAMAEATLRDGEVAGPLRLNVTRLAALHLLAPVLPGFIATHPQIAVEIVTDECLIDIVAGGFDAGIRLGERLEQDMVAVPLGPPVRMVVVASPAYLARVGVPGTLADLLRHACLNTCRATDKRVYRWEFERDGKRQEIDVSGPLVSNEPGVLQAAALAGAGLAYLFEPDIQDDLARGTLTAVLSEWTPAFPGFHIYFPSRMGMPPPLRAFLDHMRQPSTRAQMRKHPPKATNRSRLTRANSFSWYAATFQTFEGA